MRCREWRWGWRFGRTAWLNYLPGKETQVGEPELERKLIHRIGVEFDVLLRPPGRNIEQAVGSIDPKAGKNNRLEMRCRCLGIAQISV